MIDRMTRLELNALSKDVFGTSSRWQKMVDKGYKEQVTEEVTETVPAEKEGDAPTTRQVWVPVKNSGGSFMYVIKRHTVETVLAYMVEQKIKLDALRDQIKKQYEAKLAEQKATEEAKKLNQEFSGSANLS